MRAAGKNDRPVWVVIGATLAAVLIFSAGRAIAGFRIVQITHNQTLDFSPRVSGPEVVWEHHDGHDWEIFLYATDTGVTTQVTDNERNDREPRVEAGHVVWFGDDGADFEIYQFEVGSGEHTQITNNGYDDLHAEIGDGVLVWQGRADGDDEIFACDMETRQVTRLTNNQVEDRNPRVEGGIAVWRRRAGDAWRIVRRPIGSPSELVIDTPGGDGWAPRVRDGRTVWYGQVGEGTELFVHDPIRGSRQVSCEGLDVSAPRHDGTTAVFALSWRRMRWIRKWRFDTEELTPVTLSGSLSYHSPDVDGDLIVWLGADSTEPDHPNTPDDADLEVFYLSQSTGTGVQVTRNEATDIMLSISGERIVWCGRADGDFEIYLGEWDCDADRDGYPDAACGGDDCDDQDPGVTGICR